MDFVSADRSGEAEFNSQLKDFNIGVAVSTGTAVAGATATLKRAVDYDPEAGKATLKRAGGVAEEAGQGVEGEAAGGEAAESAIAVPRASEPVDASVEVAAAGEGAEEVGEAAGGAGELASTALRTARATAGAAEVPTGFLKGAGGALLKGGAGTVLKGVGALGSIGTLGMDIASDTGGGWKAKSTADKWGNVFGIAGSAMDLVGLGLEATPLAPLGLGLQVVGTGFQLGAGLESEISSESRVDPAKGAIDTQAGKDIAAIDKPLSDIQGVSLAGTGGLAVARQQQ